jgi:hypothetical protein
MIIPLPGFGLSPTINISTICPIRGGGDKVLLCICFTDDVSCSQKVIIGSLIRNGCGQNLHWSHDGSRTVSAQFENSHTAKSVLNYLVGSFGELNA